MSGFAFGFKSDDIDDEDGVDENNDGPRSLPAAVEKQRLCETKLHTVHEMLSTLPSTISYSMHTISTDPLLILPRRELFDTRAQLLAEADVSDAKSIALVDSLGSDDIKPQLYEGGFKTWECSIDLARFLLDETMTGIDGGRSISDWTNIVEIGAGTAIPSCTVLKTILNRYPPGRPLSYALDRSRTLVVADYNLEVLTHAAIPNLLLTFAHASSQTNDDSIFSNHGELDITEELLDSFQSWLHAIGLTIYGVSGPWGVQFSQFVDRILNNQSTLILASETIYQPSSLLAFTEVSMSLLKRSDIQVSRNQALVAAKKVYFGVGGGVDEFLSCLEVAGGHASVRWDSGNTGVGRVILDIRLPDRST